MTEIGPHHVRCDELVSGYQMNLLGAGDLGSSRKRQAEDHWCPRALAGWSSPHEGDESRPVVSESAYVRSRSPVWDRVRFCSLARSYTSAATSAVRLSSTRTLLRRPMTGLAILSPTPSFSDLPGNSRKFIPLLTGSGIHSSVARHTEFCHSASSDSELRPFRGDTQPERCGAHAESGNEEGFAGH